MLTFTLTSDFVVAFAESEQLVYYNYNPNDYCSTGGSDLSELKDILDSGDSINSLFAWALKNGCSVVLNNHVSNENAEYPDGFVQLYEIATSICYQNYGQTDQFGNLVGFYSEILQKMAIFVPKLIEWSKKKEETQNSQNANNKEALLKFGTDLNAFSKELPPGRGKRALIKFLSKKAAPLLPSEMLSLLMKRLPNVNELEPKTFSKSAGESPLRTKRRKKRMAQSPLVGAVLLLLAIMCGMFGSEIAAHVIALAFVELNAFSIY
ncbi:hypothetical protein niasHT_036077 [Heterodera trifolii]|uniref:Effector protein n=1 Tax=Heterodera trifolii TaxID=157864 RepID=A0ABD2ILL2_9BILA